VLSGQVTVISDGAVNCDAKTPRLLLQTAYGSVWRPSSAKILRPLQGFEFFAIGYEVPTAFDEPSQLWDFEARECQGIKYPPLTLRVLRMSVTWPDAPICIERQWFADHQVVDLPQVVRGGATPADYHRLADAYQALISFTENISRGRGKKSGDGALWPGGVPEFLDDLWDTIDRYTKRTGRPWVKLTGKGGDSFRSMMKRHPSSRSLSTYLAKAHLRAQDIESGKVTRANYRQFVAEQGH